MRVVKQRYYDLNNPQNRQFLSDHSDYEHLGNKHYLKYLNRVPKSQYKAEYERMLKQGYRVKDNNLVKLANLKLDNLQKGYANIYNWVNMDEVDDKYNPTFLSDIISHNKSVLDQRAYLHYMENLVKESIKLPTYYMNSYGVYHNDTFHPHTHIVLYQDRKFYNRKPINEKNSKFYINKSQLKRLKLLINYDYNKDIVPNINKEEVIGKLIKAVKSYKKPNVITPKKEFLIKFLLNLINKRDVTDPNLKKLKKIMYRYKNYNISHNKKVDFSKVDKNSNTFSVAILKNKLEQKIKENNENVYLEIISKIKDSSKDTNIIKTIENEITR